MQSAVRHRRPSGSPRSPAHLRATDTGEVARAVVAARRATRTADGLRRPHPVGRHRRWTPCCGAADARLLGGDGPDVGAAVGLAAVGALTLVLAARLLVVRRETFLLAERARGASVASVAVRALVGERAARRARHRRRRRRAPGCSRPTPGAPGPSPRSIVRGRRDRARDRRGGRRGRARGPDVGCPPTAPTASGCSADAAPAASPPSSRSSRSPPPPWCRCTRPRARADRARAASTCCSPRRPCCWRPPRPSSSPGALPPTLRALSGLAARRRGPGARGRDRPGEPHSRHPRPAAHPDDRGRARRLLRHHGRHRHRRPAHGRGHRRRRAGAGRRQISTPTSSTPCGDAPGVTGVAGAHRARRPDVRQVERRQGAAARWSTPPTSPRILAAHGRPVDPGLAELGTATGDAASRRSSRPSLQSTARARRRPRSWATTGSSTCDVVGTADHPPVVPATARRRSAGGRRRRGRRPRGVRRQLDRRGARTTTSGSTVRAPSTPSATPASPTTPGVTVTERDDVARRRGGRRP